jgi:hypothetical protein
MTRSRHVYYLAGYDAARADTLYRRFASQLEAFKRTWNVEATLSAMDRINTQPFASWATSAQASDWHVDTVHEVLLWDDIIREDLARPLAIRLVDAASAYAHLIASGTVLRFAKAHWRYAAFFLFPLIVIVLFAGCALFFASLLSDVLSLIGLNRVLVSSFSSILLFVSLMQSFGSRLRLFLLLELWSFADAYIHRRRPNLDARLDQFANLVVNRARGAAVDEIVIVGHSLGAMLAIDLLDRALANDPGFTRAGPQICLLTVGATIPKITLCRSADQFRSAVARVAAEPAIAWTEIQSRDDAISFYKFDPVSLQRLAGDRLNGKPVVRRVQIHDMLQSGTFWRNRLHILRFHYQCVMANEKPAPYDYFLAVCGPVPFVRWISSPRGLLDFVTADAPRLQQTLAGRQWPRPGIAYRSEPHYKEVLRTLRTSVTAGIRKAKFSAQTLRALTQQTNARHQGRGQQQNPGAEI